MTVTQPSLLARVAHFLTCGVCIGALTLGLSEGLSRLRPQLGVWALAGGAALAALPGAFIVQTSLSVFSPAALAYVSWSGLLLQTLPMNMVLSLIGWRFLGRRLEAQRVAEVVREAGAGLSHRLPLEFRSAPILMLRAEDHYLRVFTTRGEALIHMRIGDAEQVLDALDGVRTHRSYWVARRSFRSVVRKEGRMALQLENGQTIPVARNRVEAVNAWLARITSD
ncbi:MAG: LytTR family DNA-binding domain-containing protein [Alphaproteobacteria bacterium]